MPEKAEYIYVCVSCGNTFSRKPDKCSCWGCKEFTVNGIPAEIWHKLLNDVKELKQNVMDLKSKQVEGDS